MGGCLTLPARAISQKSWLLVSRNGHLFTLPHGPDPQNGLREL